MNNKSHRSLRIRLGRKTRRTGLDVAEATSSAGGLRGGWPGKDKSRYQKSDEGWRKHGTEWGRD